MELKKPKEFYLFQSRNPGETEWRLACEPVTGHPDQKLLIEDIADSIRVIEYSAYNQAIYELEKARTDRTKAENERDVAYKHGYTEAVTDYGIWKSGTQFIGCLETPVKEVLAKKFPTGSEPESK